MSRRNKLEVNTFPFLAVLLSAMGSLILVLLVMDRRSKLVAQARAKEEHRRQLEDQAIAKLQRRDENEAKKRAHEKKRDALRSKVNADEQAVSAELREVQEQLAKTADRLKNAEEIVQGLREQIKGEQERITKQEVMLKSAQEESSALASKAATADKERAKLASELVQLEAMLHELKKSKASEAQAYSVVPYNGKWGENRQPLYIECAEAGYVFHPEQAKLDGPSQERLRAELATRVAKLVDPSKAYLLLLVRPNGIARYYELQALLREMKVEYGYELVDAEWKFNIPANARNDKPENNPKITKFPVTPSTLPIVGAPLGQGGGPGASLSRPVSPEAPAVSMHKPVTRPEGSGSTGIGVPSVLPNIGGTNHTLPQPPATKPPVKDNSGPSLEPAPALRPAQITGQKDIVFYVECKADYVIVYPTKTRIAIEHLNHSNNHNKLYLTIRQLIAKQNARTIPGEPAPRMQVRFLIHKDAERSFHRAYPVLEALSIPKSQYNLQADDDVARIVAGS